MKRIFALLGIVVLALALGCTREALVGESPKTVVTLTMPTTKTTLGELSDGNRPVYWANGDKIAINGVVSEPLNGLKAHSRSARFSFSDFLEPPYQAVYPETIWKDDFSVTLPQEAQSGVFPLIAYGSEESLPVMALTAAVKLSVKKYSGENPDTDKIVSIAIISPDTQLSGDFAIEFETGTLVPYLNPVDEDRMVLIRPNLTLSDTAEEFFIPVPAGKYSFTVRLTDIQGHSMEISTSSPKEFTNGEIKSFPEIEFLPTP